MQIITDLKEDINNTSSSNSNTSTTSTSKTNISDLIIKTNGLMIKPKNYRVKNSEWQCRSCDIYCNSKAQYEVHLLSQKHKINEKKSYSLDERDSFNSSNNSNDLNVSSNDSNDHILDLDENNNLNISKYTIDINNFSIAEQYKIVAQNYLIPESKKIGKFEKFGFYCPKCDAYMTGQIQLVMHVKGSKHQFYSPGEIPGYIPPKTYNPGFKTLSKSANINRQSQTYMEQKNFNFYNIIKDQKFNNINSQNNNNTNNNNNNSSSSSQVQFNSAAYLNYLFKSQAFLNNPQYYARFYHTTPQPAQLSTQVGTAYINHHPQFNHFNPHSNSPVHPNDQLYHQHKPIFNATTTTPSTPNITTQTNAFFGNFINPTQQQHSFNSTQSAFQPIRIITTTTTPSNNNLFLYNNSLNNNNQKENLDNCLNRSFENNFASFSYEASNVNNNNNNNNTNNNNNSNGISNLSFYSSHQSRLNSSFYQHQQATIAPLLN